MTTISAHLTVYVPAGEDTLGIKPGSGIVGSPDGTRSTRAFPDGQPLVKIDYEGNVHHAVNIVTFEDRVHHAAGRHCWNNGRGYPTVARQWVTADKVHEVGTYYAEWDNKTFHLEITDQAALDAWLARWQP